MVNLARREKYTKIAANVRPPASWISAAGDRRCVSTDGTPRPFISASGESFRDGRQPGAPVEGAGAECRRGRRAGAPPPEETGRAGSELETERQLEAPRVIV